MRSVTGTKPVQVQNDLINSGNGEAGAVQLYTDRADFDHPLAENVGGPSAGFAEPIKRH